MSGNEVWQVWEHNLITGEKKLRSEYRKTERLPEGFSFDVAHDIADVEELRAIEIYNRRAGK